MQRQLFYALVSLCWCIMYRVVGFSVLWLFSLPSVAILLMKKQPWCLNNLLVIWWSTRFEYIIPCIFNMGNKFSMEEILEFPFLFWQFLHLWFRFLAQVKQKYRKFLNWALFSSSFAVKCFWLHILIHEHDYYEREKSVLSKWFSEKGSATKVSLMFRMR